MLLGFSPVDEWETWPDDDLSNDRLNACSTKTYKLVARDSKTNFQRAKSTRIHLERASSERLFVLILTSLKISKFFKKQALNLF
jgi:hypothetical protein